MTDYHSPLEARGELPVKMTGQHRWICYAMYCVTDNMVEDAEKGIGVYMDSDHLLEVGMVCWDCGNHFGSEEIGPVCPVGGN